MQSTLRFCIITYLKEQITTLLIAACAAYEKFNLIMIFFALDIIPFLHIHINNQVLTRQVRIINLLDIY